MENLQKGVIKIKCVNQLIEIIEHRIGFYFAEKNYQITYYCLKTRYI